jgi:hypothetical protein
MLCICLAAVVYEFVATPHQNKLRSSAQQQQQHQTSYCSNQFLCYATNGVLQAYNCLLQGTVPHHTMTLPLRLQLLHQPSQYSSRLYCCATC